MKKTMILALAGLMFTSSFSHAAQTAQARMYCLSLQFQRAAVNDSYGFAYHVDLSTLSVGVNGELAPTFLTSNYTHSAFVEIYSELYDATENGAIAINVPETIDADGDGFPDFFQVSQGITNVTTSGVLQSQSYYSSATTFQANWNRDAGSTTGTCSYQVYDPSNPFNSILFTHTFTLLEYTGPLAYTPGTNTVSGNLALTQTGNPASTLTGLLAFAKSPTNRFNQLTLQSGTLTNGSLEALAFFAHTYWRDTPWPTNYYGAFEFADGDLSTAEDDYWSWELTIDDLNDGDHDGIPDFSDDPAVTSLPRAPMLTLAPGATNLWLTISGDVGRLHQIQGIDSLSSTNWQNVLSTNLTSDPQMISLPLPSGLTRFWRVLAQ